MKVCSKCGIEKDESEFAFYSYIPKSKAITLNSACRKCHQPSKLVQKRSKHKRRRKINESRLSNRKNNAEKTKIERRKYKQKQINELRNDYLKTALINKGFSHEQISSNLELIELQREIIKNKRLCKTLKNSERL